jgi:predicted RNA-binding Zn-ribbon protein involved in translation (DUF1610 family)
MTILQNSAKCTACGKEIHSTHRHDFYPHYCPKEPAHNADGEEIFRFAVDGGLAYIRRIGSFIDTSKFDDPPEAA